MQQLFRNTLLLLPLAFCLLSCEQREFADKSDFGREKDKKFHVTVEHISTANPKQNIFVWQGFEHHWQRRFLNFRIPHRISQLTSFIQNIPKQSSFIMGQSTGVDGNYMHPKGFYSVFQNENIIKENYRVSLQWEDQIFLDAVPQSKTQWQQNITLPFPKSREDIGENRTHLALLNGFDLITRCVDTATYPCNSDGIWPYRFYIQMNQCHLQDDGLECLFHLEIARGWTPHHGGIPYIAPKPLNEIIHYDLRVEVLMLRGESHELHMQNATLTSAQNKLQDILAPTSHVDIQGISQRYPRGLIAINGLGFTLNSDDGHWGTKHRGRYIDRLAFHLKSQHYESKTGRMRGILESQIAAPKTVRQSAVTYDFQTALIQLGPSTKHLLLNQTVGGHICRNSRNAPFFSRWKRCTKTDLGSEQSRDYVALNADSFAPDSL